MKRDIFFDEFTPLNFKSEAEESKQNLQLIFLFEILLVACGCIILPKLEETCEQIPLSFWVSIMIIFVNLHLIIAGLEMFLKKFEISIKNSAVHYFCSGLILMWMAYGNFLIFYQGLGCLGQQDYIVSSIFISTLDILSLLMILYYSCITTKGVNNQI